MKNSPFQDRDRLRRLATDDVAYAEWRMELPGMVTRTWEKNMRQT